MKAVSKAVDEIAEMEDYTYRLPYQSGGSSKPYTFDTSFNLIIEVIAGFKQKKVAAVAVDFFCAISERLHPDIGTLHPEFMFPVFDKLDIVMTESAEVGMRLCAAVTVDCVSHIELPQVSQAVIALLFHLLYTLLQFLS